MKETDKPNQHRQTETNTHRSMTIFIYMYINHKVYYAVSKEHNFIPQTSHNSINTTEPKTQFPTLIQPPFNSKH